ncbi:HNH endonuclease [Streptosporangium amethystogenes subsp. fukuiense]|uniref:HNH endonuclease n=1 Tax=Streptosporangium amethystogenes subsp. fukuiense TaxID=698418 RepID=A0ABW2T6Z4_9ACTN
MPSNAFHDLPDWRDEKLGTMIRVALWLVAEIGEGNEFTTTQLHEAFPEQQQTIRRLRDLREYDWVIETNRSLPQLAPTEMRLAKVGIHLWEPGKRRLRTKRPTQVRREVFTRDGFACIYCGLAAGRWAHIAPEEGPLRVAHVTPIAAGGNDSPENMVTLCVNCYEDFKKGNIRFSNPEDLQTLIDELSLNDQSRLLAWIVMDGKPATQVEKAWGLYRMLAPGQRAALKKHLGQAVINQTEPGANS